MAGTVLFSSIFGMITYYFAFRVHEGQKSVLPEEDKKALLKQRYWEHRNGKKVQNEKLKSDFGV
jgi:hypothetical protein